MSFLPPELQSAMHVVHKSNCDVVKLMVGAKFRMRIHY